LIIIAVMQFLAYMFGNSSSSNPN